MGSYKVSDLLTNCESETSYGLAKYINMCLEEPCFPDWWKVPSIQNRIYKNFVLSCLQKCWGEIEKSYHPVTLLSVVNKVFEKLIIDKLVKYHETFGLLTHFQYVFRAFYLVLQFPFLNGVNMSMPTIYFCVHQKFGILYLQRLLSC